VTDRQVTRTDFPKIVTLCGSTRHKQEFEEANRTLTRQGVLVISVGVFGHADGITLTADDKAALDELHRRKIDLADEVLIVNPDARIGDSTRSEIQYAAAHGKPVRYLVAPAPSGSAAHCPADKTGHHYRHR
jgi:nucleoside 2-deoxyribosyltransferase